jgi:uncharacterized glyoxalase superfamily protein PhnB
MQQYIGLVTVVVRDYDEALEFYCRKLHFECVEDTRLTESKRWVVVRPSNSKPSGCGILLAKAANDNQIKAVGNQTGGRVALFLYTDNLERDYLELKNQGVTIVRNPITEAYGKVLVFEDLYGNKWDLIEPNTILF